MDLLGGGGACSAAYTARARAQTRSSCVPLERASWHLSRIKPQSKFTRAKKNKMLDTNKNWDNSKMFAKKKDAKFLLVIVFISILSISQTVQADSTIKIIVYGSRCKVCDLKYIDELKLALEEIGVSVQIELHDLTNDPEAVRNLARLHQSFGVPEWMRGKFVVNVDDRYLFENYVPTEIISNFLANKKQDYKNLVVIRDMLTHSYRVIENGDLRECEIQSSISDCVSTLEKVPFASVLNFVLIGGLLDGFNPCAFAVLLFFIALLFTAGTTISHNKIRRRVVMIGSIYIVAVFTAYFAIGLAFFVTVNRTFSDFFMKVGAILMIFFGLINVKDYFWPGRGFTLGIPSSQWGVFRRLMRQMTFPATFTLGLMVGVFEFPCTGAIYLAIIGLLAYRKTFMDGLFYLTLYNLAFIFPLIVILAIASQKTVMSFSLERWQKLGHRKMKLISGLIISLLGIFLILYTLL